MTSPRKKPITQYLTTIICLTALSSFSIKSMAEEVIVVHKEVDASCTESTLTKEMYNMLAEFTSKGACPRINSKGKEIFGGCKPLSGDGMIWFYDMPEFYGSNFKADIKEGCDEWLTVGGKSR